MNLSASKISLKIENASRHKTTEQSLTESIIYRRQSWLVDHKNKTLYARCNQTNLSIEGARRLDSRND
jgi:hypothetical protein